MGKRTKNVLGPAETMLPHGFNAYGLDQRVITYVGENNCNQNKISIDNQCCDPGASPM